MRKICTALILIFSLIPAKTLSAQAVEPTLEFPSVFNTINFPKMMQNSTWKFKCSTSWDQSSKFSEIIARCNKAGAEIYMHGNASPIAGDSSKYNQGNVSYLSFTIKKAELYSDLEYFGGEMCAGAVMGPDPKSFLIIKDWVKKNYKTVTNKKKISKVFNGHEMSIIGGIGPIRTVTCGTKPS